MPTKAGTAYVDVVGNFAPLNRQIARMGSVSTQAGKSFSRSMKVVNRDAEASRRRVAGLSREISEIGGAAQASSRQATRAFRQIESSSARALRALRSVEAAQRRVSVSAQPSVASGQVRQAGNQQATALSPTATALIPVVSKAAVEAAAATAARQAASRMGTIGGARGAYSTYGLARSFGRGRAASTVAEVGARASSALSMGKSFAKTFAKGVGPGLATMGVENILTSALQGDMKSAGFKAGGALVGGVLGSFAGPAGTMIGVGLGSMAGDLVGGLFSSGKKTLTLQQKLAASAKQVTFAYRGLRASSQTLARSGDALVRSHGRARKASREVTAAERQLTRMRRQFGPNSRQASQAEQRLATARQRSAKASKAAQRAERLHGIERKVQEKILKGTILEERHYLIQLQKNEKHLRKEIATALKNGRSHRVLIHLKGKLAKNQQELNDTQKKQNETLREATRTIGPKYEKFLKNASGELLRTGKQAKQVQKDIEKPIRAFKKTGEAGEDSARRAKRGYDKLGRGLGAFAGGAIKNMGKASGAVKSFDTNTNRALGAVRTGTNQTLVGLGVAKIDFGVSKKQAGGAIVPGSGEGDSFRTTLPVGSFVLNKKATAAFGFRTGGHVPVMLEPGERTFYPHEVRAIGRPTLEAANSVVPRFATGGSLTEPQLRGPEPLRGGGQAAVGKAFDAAKRYIAKHRPKRFAGLGTAPGQLGAVERLAAKMGLQVTSGYRPGDDGFHGVNRARDFSNSTGPTPEMMRFALAVAKRWGRRLLELIYSPLGWSIDNGRKVPPYAVAEHYNHVHVAMQRGGLLDDPVQKFAGGGLVQNVGEILMRNGLDVESAAGILGNAWRESKWKTSSVGTGGGGLWGFTTSPVSLADMQAYAKRQGMPWTSALAQTQFMLHHLPHSMRSAMNAMGDVADTTTYFMDKWERPGVPALGERIEGAKKAFRILKGFAGVETEAEEPIVKQVKGSRRKTTYEVVPGKKGKPASFKATRKKRNYKVATAPLEFEPLPKTLEGCTKELRRRQTQLGDYRDAARDEEDPAVKSALEKNVGLLERRISELKQRRTQLLGSEALKKINDAAEFKHWTDPQSGVFTVKQNEREEFAERAEQAVTKEPEEPANVTADWVNNTLKQYVDGTESKAYGKVLETEVDWRNAIIRAQGEADRRVDVWKERIEHIKDRIEKIYGYRKNGQTNAWEKHKGLIPDLKDKIAALRANVKKTNQETLPEWKESLNELQGRGRSREVLPASTFFSEEPGQFGGSIFDTQWTIKGLGLKVSQALANVEPDPTTEERNALLEELLRQANQRTAVAESQFATLRDFDATYPVGQFPPYAGKAHSGAVVPGPPSQERTMIVRGQERIRTPEQELAMAESARRLGGDAVPQLIVNGSIVQEAGDTRDPVEAVINDRRFPIAVRQVAMGGRVTPGGARS